MKGIRELAITDMPDVSIGNVQSDEAKTGVTVLLFDKGEDRKNAINENSEKLHEKMGVIKGHEGIIRAFTDIVIMIAILTFLFVSIKLNKQGQITIGQGLVAIVTLASSFGPVVALSNLSNNLIQTFACAQR